MSLICILICSPPVDFGEIWSEGFFCCMNTFRERGKKNKNSRALVAGFNAWTPN